MLEINYLLFDLGNVFIFWDKEPFIKAVIDGLPDKTLCTSKYSDPYWRDLISYESNLEKGHLNWIQFCEAIELRYNWKGCSDSLLKSFQDIFEPNEKLIDWFLTADLKAHTVMMSNTNVYHWQWISKTYAHLLNKFDYLHLSHEVGSRKPSREYYLSSLFSLEWNRSFFVDDLLENLTIPKELGAEIHHFKGNDDLWRHLERCTF